MEKEPNFQEKIDASHEEALKINKTLDAVLSVRHPDDKRSVRDLVKGIIDHLNYLKESAEIEMLFPPKKLPQGEISNASRSEGSGAEIPSWRKTRETKRSFEGEMTWKIPEKLYRNSNIGDIFLLFRDKRMPLVHFGGSPDSEIEKNSLGNFWFDEPVRMRGVNQFDVILEMDSSSLGKGAPYAQKGAMKYYSDTQERSAPSISNPDFDVTYYEGSKREIPEYHIGSDVPLEFIRVIPLRRTVVCLKGYSENIEKILNGQMKDPSKGISADQETLYGINSLLNEILKSVDDKTDTSTRKTFSLLENGKKNEEVLALLPKVKELCDWIAAQPTPEESGIHLRDIFSES